MVAEKRPLLLHATIVNTIYVKRDRNSKNRRQGGGGRGGKGGRRGDGKLTIDARDVLERYQDQVWMEDVPVESVAICRMGAAKVEVDGVVVDEKYTVEAEVCF